MGRGAKEKYAGFRSIFFLINLWSMDQISSGMPFFEQSGHVAHVRFAFLGVARIFIPGRAPGEKRSFLRVGTGNGAVTNTVAVNIEVTPPFGRTFQTCCIEYFI